MNARAALLLGVGLLVAPGLWASPASLAAVCEGAPAAELPRACRAAVAAARAEEVMAAVQPWVNARRYGAALQMLEEALRHAPNHPGLQQRLAEVRSLADEFAWRERQRGAEAVSAEQADQTLLEIRCTRLTGESALSACEQALRARPDDVKLLAARGDHLLTLGRVGEAEQSYRAAAARSPSPALEQKIATAGAARAPLPPRPAADEVPAPSGGYGRYHALVIGNNAYQHLPRLQTAIKDAQVMAEVLRTQYRFEVALLQDATRADIVEALDDYRARLKPTDNLLIYYAGHGWLDTEADKGFWLPIDAREDKRTQWVSNDTVRDALRALKAKHVLVVADSCFSGALTREAGPRAARTRDYVDRMARTKARQVLSSGGLEPVADSGGSGHSPFAAALIGVLRQNVGVLDATTLFSELRRPVALSSDQVPQFADIRMAGHQGGDFLFVRSK